MSELDETRSILLGDAKKRFGAIPAARIVDHVLAMTEDADFPVRAAALEALIRRMMFARRDELAIVKRPSGRALWGSYRTGRPKERRSASRPYDTELWPARDARLLGGSCDCPDFTRGSLALCKHLLVVLESVHADGKSLAAPAPTAGRLVWDPRLPLQGPLDRALGLGLDGAVSVPSALRRVFEGGRIRSRLLGDLHSRVEVLAALESAKLIASPAARSVVAEELAIARRRLTCRAQAPRVERELKSLERKLYPYQRAGVKRFLEEGRLLLADDMGLGKTMQAIAACHALFRARRIRRGIVIAPASLKPQWLREWQDATSVPATIVEGTPDERRAIYEGLTSGFLILGYEQLLRDFEHVRTLAPEIVVVDEAQRIKNYATKSATFVKALTPEYRLVLTGTPMENRLEELASLLDWIDDVALSPKWRLIPWHTTHDGDGDRGATGARNLVTLRARMAPSTLRRMRKDVLSQLPSRTDTRVPVPLTEQQRAAHDERDRPIATLVQTAKKRPLTQPEFFRLMSLLAQQRIISNGLAQLHFDEHWPECSVRVATPAVLDGLFAPKLGVLRALIQDLAVAQERKIVVFSQWRRMLRLAEWAVRDVLAAAGQRAVFFTGAESTAQRTRAIADFHDDPQVSVMFLSDAGGVGLNLQRAANACINLELPWNPAVLEQRIARIYRLGQDKPIDVLNLVSEGSIESRIASVVGAKQALFTGVFESTTDSVSFDSAASFTARVEGILDPSVVSSAPAASAEAEDSETEDPFIDAVPEPAPAVRPASPGALSALGNVRVERTPDGALRLEAPPEAAAALAGMFELMAQLLRSASPPP